MGERFSSRRDSTIVTRHEVSVQRGFGAFSVSVSQLPETIHYIQNQVEHHRTRTFQQEYLAFLKRHEHSTRCRLLMPGSVSTTNICRLTMTL
jgi:hypothetical protein